MLNLGRIWAGTVVLLAAGCATHPERGARRVSDWSDDRIAAAAPAAARTTNQVNSTPTPVAASNSAPAVTAVMTPRVAPPAVNETWVPLQRWCRANALSGPSHLGASASTTYAVSSSNGVFVLSPGSQLGRWDGMEVLLSYAPQSINYQPYVHALDIRKTIGPLLSGPPTRFSGDRRTIVIDPGHGGENPGTRSAIGGLYEKNLTLDWARRLQSLLAAQGWDVYLTRTNDTDLALSNRVAVADRHDANLFLSLHFNSAGTNRLEFGLETYCLTPCGMPSTTSREFGDDLSSLYPNNAFDEQNLRLACQVHRSLMRLGGAHDRGVRRARYLGVLRGQQRPAILVEGGYLSNPHEARLIANPAYRQKLAAAVAAALQPWIDERARAQSQDTVPPADRQSGPLSAKLNGS